MERPILVPVLFKSARTHVLWSISFFLFSFSLKFSKCLNLNSVTVQEKEKEILALNIKKKFEWEKVYF
jgi:hypothetical protein